MWKDSWYCLLKEVQEDEGLNVGSVGQCFKLPRVAHLASLCLISQSYLTLCDPVNYRPPDSSVHGDYPGKNAGVGCHNLLQGIFPNQGLNPGLLHCRRFLYQLSYQGGPTPLVTCYLFICLNVAYPGHCPRLPHMRLLILFNSWNTIPE